MMTAEVKEDQEKKMERMKSKKSYFEYSVMKPELNPIAKILLEKGYSISSAFKDAFKAGNYQQLFQLLKTMDDDTVKNAVKIKDELGRNIFHSLSKAPEGSAFSDICNTLMTDYNLDPNELDKEGNSPIMLAAQEGKYDLVKALECVGCSVKDTNYKNENSINLLMKGKRVKKYNRRLLKYLIKKGVDINTLYEESHYATEKDTEDKDKNQAEVNVYKCTSIMHLLRTELMDYWDKGELLEEIFEQSSQRVNPNTADSDGKDMFMHLAILNEFELCKYVISCISKNYAKTAYLSNGDEHVQQIEKNDLRHRKGQTITQAQIVDDEEEVVAGNKYEAEKQVQKDAVVANGNGVHEEEKTVHEYVSKYGIDFSRTDHFGRSVIHYIVTPVDYGSFENEAFLNHMLKFGFQGDISDKDGLKPHDYAAKQSSGRLLSVFQERGICSKDIVADTSVLSYKKLEDWKEVDYMKDAQDFLDLVKMNVDKEKLVPCDPAGKFNDDCVVYQEPEKDTSVPESNNPEDAVPQSSSGRKMNIYDCHLTRVDIGREERDDYLFYKLQVVHDKSRDLWILFTRWGRIGETGAFQKTPYSKEECIAQFEDIFLKKTKNEWKNRHNFKKHWWKYQLTNVNYSNVSHQDYLVPFDFSASKASNLQPSVQEILREITQVAMYVKGIKNAGVDTDQMPFSNINRKDLLKARESLTKLREILEELEPLEAQLNRFNKDGKDKVVALREKCWYHSSRFYEMIPHEQFKNEIVPPINKLSTLKEKAEMIDNLINFEMASKILLGAHKNAQEVNPLDYCLEAMGVEIGALDKTSTEYDILKEYCVRTWPENNHAGRKIRNIFKIQRKGEGEAFEDFSELGNKFLLFHGSRISNFMGIMSQGLRVAPPEAPKTGYMFGKGVYFADMFQKSINY